MPIDMPPQAPVYHIEAAAPVQDNSLFSSLVSASRAIKDRVMASSELSPMEKMSPPLNLKSPALTKEDRIALVSAYRATWQGELAAARINIPKSYIGNRIAMSIEFANIRRKEKLDVSAAKALRCRMIASAFDSRAGLYLKGGEKAANQARLSISARQINECKKFVIASTNRSTPPIKTVKAPISVRLSVNASDPVRIDTMSRSSERNDLKQDDRNRVNIKNSEPVRIEPQNRRLEPVRIYLDQGTGR